MKRIHTGLLVTSFFCTVLLNAQEDSVLHAKDDVIETGSQLTLDFFQNGEKVADPSKTTIINAAKKSVSLASLLNNKQPELVDHVLADLDMDGKKELLVYNLVVSAPKAKDEIWICKMISPVKYQYAAKLIGGLTIITEEKKFNFNLTEFFTGFYTCPACNYTDTSDVAPIFVRDVTAQYVKGKLVVQKADQEMKSIINDNLDKLGEQLKPIAAHEDDDGTRKEFAIVLAAFHYSTGKNLASTKALFTKYYKAPDAARIWAAFSKKLQIIGTQASF